MIITDVCLCGFTDHGHCGIIDYETGIFITKDKYTTHGK